MGNQSTALQNYDLGDPLSITVTDEEKTGWVFYPAKHTDGSLASAFFYDAVDTEQDIVHNATKYYKVLRHPGIPRFISVSRTQDGWMLIMERLTPLARLIDKLTPTEICAGLHSILDTLAFLHVKANLCHNSISLSSVFVGTDGGWRLGGLEFVCPLTGLTTAQISRCRLFYPSMPRPPEDMQQSTTNEAESLSAEYSRARDVYCFGVLAEYLLSYLDTLEDSRRTFELRIQEECLHADAKQRPDLNSLLNERLFSNDFLEILNFLKNVTLKSADEKNAFFSTLPRRLFQLPAEVLARRLVKHLLARFVLLEYSAKKHVLPHLLMPAAAGTERRDEFVDGEVNPLLPEDLFRRYIIPEVFKIMHVRDVHVRSALLEHFAHYVRLFDENTLKNFIFPQILLGLRDHDDALVELSLHALATLVPILGGDAVIGAQRAKLFKQSVPKFCMKNGGQTKQVVNNGIPATPRIGPGLPNMDERQAEKESRQQKMEQRKEERRQRRERCKLQQKEVIEEHTDDTSIQPTIASASTTNTTSTDNVSPMKNTPSTAVKSDTDDDDNSISDDHWSDTADDFASAATTPHSSEPATDWSNVTSLNHHTSPRPMKPGVMQLKTPPQTSIMKQQSPKDDPPTSLEKKRLQKSLDDRSLGAEFDVMAITVKKSLSGNNTDDPIAAMFAQMQPVISATPSLLSMLSADATQSSPQSLFAMAECDDTDEGWGDDFDWNMTDVQ